MNEAAATSSEDDHAWRHLVEAAQRDGVAKLVVGAIVHDQHKILILRRSPDDDFMAGIEELPSGTVEPGETLLEALHRELAEEIGHTGPLTIAPGFATSFDYTSRSGRKTRQHTFAVTYTGHPIELSPEHTTHRWITPTDLPTSDLTAETARTIRQWAAENKPAH